MGLSTPKNLTSSGLQNAYHHVLPFVFIFLEQSDEIDGIGFGFGFPDVPELDTPPLPPVLEPPADEDPAPLAKLTEYCNLQSWWASTIIEFGFIFKTANPPALLAYNVPVFLEGCDLSFAPPAPETKHANLSSGCFIICIL